jgi:hypothetical protein
MSRSLQDAVLTSKLEIYRNSALSAVRTWEGLLAAFGLVMAVVILLDIGGPFLAPFKLMICFVLPGWALLRKLEDAEPAARFVWTLSASALFLTVFAFPMAWFGIWHPRPAAAVILLAAALSIFRFPVRGGLGARPVTLPWRSPRLFLPLDVRTLLRREALRQHLHWIILSAAMVMWGVSLVTTKGGNLDKWGLLTQYSVAWYLSVAAVLGLCVWGITARRLSSARFLSAALAGLVVMLYWSASLLTTVPRLPWTYKHIAVTDFIGATGQAEPAIDIYNRWPGFFASSAFLGEVIGLRDALDYAAWAEIGFALMNVVTVLAIARAISKNPRIYWTATLVFVLTNWVNQNYYSPQAFAYALYLAMCLILLTFLRSTPVTLVRIMEERLTRPQLPVVEMFDRHVGSRLRLIAIIAVLLLQAAIVVSHQLTPYLALLGLFPLIVLGYFRPRWLALALMAITLLYLIPNLEFVRQKYGLFSGFDVLANAGYRPQGEALNGPGNWLSGDRLMARAAAVLSVITGLLAAAGFVRRLIQGEVRTTLMVVWLAVAPAFALVGQSYGGEARLRVYLFAVPWLAIGVAWLFWSSPLPTRKAVIGAAASLTIMSILFGAAYYQPEEGRRLAQDDVIASKWLDAQIQPGDVVYEPESVFPLQIGPNYPKYFRSVSVKRLSVLVRDSSPSVSPDVIRRHAESSKPAKDIYIVFSDNGPSSESSGEAAMHNSLSRFETDISRSPDGIGRVYESDSVRIYRIGRAG